MKRIFIVVVILFVCLSMGWAYQDSFAYLWESVAYPNLIRCLKNNMEEQIVLNAYDNFMQENFSEVDKSRIEYHMVRYYVDNGNKAKAEEHLQLESEFFEKIQDEEDVLKKDIAELDLLSAEYYIDKKISKGLGTSTLTKRLFKEHPDEFYVALTEAFRRLSTPAIAGGSSKDALELFREISVAAGEMNDLDRFSLYSGMGMACYERKLFDDSRMYFGMATEIYKSDVAMDEYLAKLKKREK